MYTTLPHLQSAIRVSLQKGELCRIYKDTLDACWPNLTEEAQAEAIAHFAAQNRWSVAHRNLGSLGVVAEFKKADVAVHAE